MKKSVLSRPDRAVFLHDLLLSTARMTAYMELMDMSKPPRRMRATEKGLENLKNAQDCLFLTEEGLIKLRDIHNPQEQELGKRLSYEAIAEKAFVHRSTVSRLFSGKRIDFDNIRVICDVLQVDWKEIVGLNPSPQGDGLEIILTGSIDEVKAQMNAILADLEAKSGDTTVSICIIRSGSVVLVIDGTPEGLERIKSLYNQGELMEVAGFPVENVRFESEKSISDGFIDLGQWLENNFTEALEAGWRSFEELLETRELAFRLQGKKLAKSIELKENQKIILALEIAEEEDEEIQVIIKIYPGRDLTYLPSNLEIYLIMEDGEIIEVEVGDETRYLEQEVFFEPEEEFQLQFILDDVIRTEEFFV